MPRDDILVYSTVKKPAGNIMRYQERKSIRIRTGQELSVDRGRGGGGGQF